jgi:two-component system CheB/CheR fusion protein
MPVNISGFGLGLYISKDIIKRHHGKIWVESETKGSSFYISLPLDPTKGIQS